MSRTVSSVIIMCFAAFAAFFLGIFFGSPMGGAIFGALVSGIACIIHSINNPLT